MPSSTSSSNERLPRGRWLLVWLCAITMAVVALSTLEAFWRVRGHEPSVDDDALLWSLERSRVGQNDPEEVVLIGASRIQQGIDLDVFGATFNGRKPIQLAIGGTTPFPVLQDLSEDESFRGVVICDIVPFLFYRSGFETKTGVAPQYLREYRHASGTAAQFSLPLIERRARLAVQERLTTRLPALALTAENLLKWSEERRLPEPSGRSTLPDRSQRADYQHLPASDLERTKQLWVERVHQFGRGPDRAEYLNHLALLDTMVRRIQGRGGEVIFVALPVSGIVRDEEEEYLPRRTYWDQLARQSTAVMVHYADYPDLAFECPEGSHLDYRDVPRFSRNLAGILKQKVAAQATAERRGSPRL